MKRIYYTLIVVALLAVTLWSCGCYMGKSDTYVVARDPTWYPLALVGKEKNVLAFSDDLLWEIAKREGFQVTTVRTGPGGVESGLDNGDFHGVMTTLQPNAFRRDRYLFSDPYFFAGPILVVPIDSDITGLSDMQDKRIGVRSGALSFYKVNASPDIHYEFYRSIVLGVEAMLRGELEGVIMDLIPAHGFARGIYFGKIKVVGKPLTRAGIRLVVAKGESEKLIEDFNNGLRKLKEDGTYQEMLHKWGLHNE